MFIIFSGVSASGKSTIMRGLCQRRADMRVLEYSSGTTRPPRESDKDAKTYIFMSHDEFVEGINQGKFFEFENVHGYYYGILNSSLEKIVKESKVCYMRDVDVHGQEKLKEYFKGKCPVVTIFLDAPNDVLEKRLLERGESPERAKVRLERSEIERACKNDYDLVIENIDKEATIDTILKFVDKIKKGC